MTRAAQMEAFIASSGWADCTRRPLAGDASNRRYDRLTGPNGQTAVLMDADPAKGEKVRPFVELARYLLAQGLSAPEIYSKDEEAGFLLIEDLGDRLFAREISAHPEMERPLYEAAVDILVHLQQRTPPDLPYYNADTTVPLAALAFDWYQLGANGFVDQAQKSLFSDTFDKIIRPYDDALTVLIQRDYHAENLLWLPDRTGVARVGLLDFQDAMIGHPAYDLASVLQDARRDVSEEIERSSFDRFVAHSDVDPDDFATAYAVFSAQRNLRILGGFTRLCLRNSKENYVDLIPRVWAQLQRSLAHPALTQIAEIVSDSLPAPNPDILNRLREKRGSCAFPS